VIRSKQDILIFKGTKDEKKKKKASKDHVCQLMIVVDPSTKKTKFCHSQGLYFILGAENHPCLWRRTNFWVAEID